MEIIGQKNVLYSLDQYSIETLPKTIAIIGPKGSGKHTIVDYIRDKFNFNDVEDITKSLTFNYIIDLYKETNIKLCVINANLLTQKQQYSLLKFIEEPSSNIFTIILSNSTNILLDTVLNRCYKIYIEPYTKEELNEFINKNNFKNNADLLLEYCKTPGQIKTYNIKNEDQIKNIVDTILNKHITINDVFSWLKEFNFNDEYDKIDIGLFLTHLYENTLNIKNIRLSELTQKYLKLYETDDRLNSQYLLTNYFVNILLNEVN